MIAHRDREHLLGLVLPDDEPVEMRLDVARLVAEMEDVVGGGLGGGPGGVSRRVLGGFRREGGEGHLVAEVVLEEIAQLALEFLGRGERFVAVGIGMVVGGHGGTVPYAGMPTLPAVFPGGGRHGHKSAAPNRSVLVDLIEDAAVVEMRLLRLCPASEHRRHIEEVDGLE